METIRLTTFLAGAFNVQSVEPHELDKAVRVAVSNGETILSIFRS